MAEVQPMASVKRSNVTSVRRWRVIRQMAALAEVLEMAWPQPYQSRLQPYPLQSRPPLPLGSYPAGSRIMPHQALGSEQMGTLTLILPRQQQQLRQQWLLLWQLRQGAAWQERAAIMPAWQRKIGSSKHQALRVARIPVYIRFSCRFQRRRRQRRPLTICPFRITLIVKPHYFMLKILCD